MRKKSLLLFFVFFICIVLFPSKTYASSDVVINEFVVHPSENKEWVEFYNPQEVDLTSYWIDDDTDFNNDSGSSSKKSLATLTIEQNDMYVSIEISSMFNNSGDRVVLFSSTGTVVDQYEYAKDPGEDISIGRSPDGTGAFQPLVALTRGESNSGVLPTATATPSTGSGSTIIPTTKPTPTVKAPTPTRVPSPTKTPTAKPVPTSIKSAQVKTATVEDNSGKKLGEIFDIFGETDVISSGARPTAVLGISTVSAKKKNVTAAKKKDEVLVKDAKTQQFPLLFIGLGGALLIGCGILIFMKVRKGN